MEQQNKTTNWTTMLEEIGAWMIPSLTDSMNEDDGLLTLNLELTLDCQEAPTDHVAQQRYVEDKCHLFDRQGDRQARTVDRGSGYRWRQSEFRRTVGVHPSPKGREDTSNLRTRVHKYTREREGLTCEGDGFTLPPETYAVVFFLSGLISLCSYSFWRRSNYF